MSPFEILLDARVALCALPEWSKHEGYYPQPIHMAHSVLDRAHAHLGIRAFEGYAGNQSSTAELYAHLEQAEVSCECDAEWEEREGDTLANLGLSEEDFR